MTKKQAPAAEIKRVGRFGAVGIINTLLDFFIFNFCSKFLQFGLIQSNVISTTIAMVFSFLANRKVVFKQERGSILKQAVIFFAVTAVGLYVIQNGIIYFLTSVWTAPLNLAVSIVRGLGIHLFSDAFYINNGAKAVATLASLTWNYLMYKRVVFR
jgi:putative flippase GtrA